MRRKVIDKRMLKIVDCDSILSIFLAYSKTKQDNFLKFMFTGPHDSDTIQIKKILFDKFKQINEKIKKDESLNSIEKTFFEIFSSYLIRTNREIEDEVIHKYCIKYIKENKSFDYVYKIYLICYDLINELNKDLGKDYELEFSKILKIKLRGYTSFEGIDFKICMNELLILTYCDRKKKVSFKTMKKIALDYIFFAIHEYTHLMQKEHIFTVDDEISEKYMQDIFVCTTDNSFYNKWHHYFNTEEEANQNAYNKFLDYFHLYFDEDKELEEKKKKRYYNILLKKVEEDREKASKIIKDRYYWLVLINDSLNQAIAKQYKKSKEEYIKRNKILEKNKN